MRIEGLQNRVDELEQKVEDLEEELRLASDFRSAETANTHARAHQTLNSQREVIKSLKSSVMEWQTKHRESEGIRRALAKRLKDAGL